MSILLTSLLGSGIAFVVFFAIFRPLESAFPARVQPFFRNGWLLDLCFMLGQYLIWTSLIFIAIYACEDWITKIVPAAFRNKVAALPMWLQIITVIILSDLLVYWAHRLQHQWDFLWRFHSVHHSSTHLDWLAAHREHPLDSIYTILAINLPAFLLGFPIEILAPLSAFRGIWSVYIHSNIRLPIGPMRMLIGAPELHHWHHCKDRKVGNYANLSPLMDLLFGTYECPDHEPEEMGINEPTSKNYLGMLMHPFRKRK